MPTKLPNPVTNRVVLYQVLECLRSEFSESRFNLNAWGIALGRAGLVGSSGYLGSDAVAHCYQKRSAALNSVNRMCQQYSELFRVCGFLKGDPDDLWITPLLGETVEIVQRTGDASVVYRVMIDSFHNPSLERRSNSEAQLRPLLAVLRAMGDLDWMLHREESLIGPLWIEDDRDPAQWSAMIERLRTLRSTGSRRQLTAALTAHRRTMNSRGIYNVGRNSTWLNWTRFPQAAGIEVGFCESVANSRLGYAGDDGRTSRRVLASRQRELTELTSRRDIRRDETSQWTAAQRHPFLRCCHQAFRRRNGSPSFDAAKWRADLAAIRAFDRDLAVEIAAGRVLHSPFAEQSAQELVACGLVPKVPTARHADWETRVPAPSAPQTITQESFVEPTAKEPVTPDAELLESLLPASVQGGSRADRLAALVARYKGTDRHAFGPAVRALLSICGAPEVALGRDGNINDRADCTITWSSDITPIELKSPAEEKKIGLKAIRQAAENKLLGSAFSVPFEPGSSSMVVGWSIPPDRSELESLIQLNEAFYSIKIVVLDFATLVGMAIDCADRATPLDWNALLTFSGVWER